MDSCTLCPKQLIRIADGTHGVLGIEIRPNHIRIGLGEDRAAHHDFAGWRLFFQPLDGDFHI